VLVVSNIDLPHKLHAVKPSQFLESKIKDFTININNDYRYMKTGYYVSLHAELLGNKVIPTSENILDTNRNPILLLRAAKAGIPTLPFIVTDSVKKIIDELGFPVVIFAVNPFIYDGYKTARNKSALYRVMKSLGMNYKFTVCAQPLKGKMLSFNSIFGKCAQNGEAKALSEKVHDLFKIPICKLHVQIVEDKAYLCGCQPIKKEELIQQDLETISKEASALSKQGDHLSV
jgi:hypothetical protein